LAFNCSGFYALIQIRPGIAIILCVPSCPLWLKEFCFPITCDVGDDARFRRFPSAPPTLFPFLLQTKHFHKSTLGRCLRGAWVALGPRLGHPRATQTQSQAGRGSQSESTHASPRTLLVFWPKAKSQWPKAELSNIFHSPHPEALPEYSGISEANQARKWTPDKQNTWTQSVFDLAMTAIYALCKSSLHAVNLWISFEILRSSGAVPSPCGSPRLASGFGMAGRKGRFSIRDSAWSDAGFGS
jgi:hypothetical protein